MAAIAKLKAEVTRLRTENAQLRAEVEQQKQHQHQHQAPVKKATPKVEK